jgi:hypothetical protein
MTNKLQMRAGQITGFTIKNQVCSVNVRKFNKEKLT